MATIDKLSLIIQGLLVAGTALRIIIILIKIAINPDEKQQMMPRINFNPRPREEGDSKIIQTTFDNLAE